MNKVLVWAFVVSSYSLYGMQSEGMDVPSSTFAQWKAFKDAVCKKNVAYVKKCSWPGANIDSHDEGGETMLHYAVRYDAHDIISYILSCKADPNSQNKKVRTPLFYARSIRAVRLLIRHGATIEHKDLHGRTPLHCYAKKKGRELAACEIIRFGANVNNVDSDKKCYDNVTPLFCAAVCPGNKGVLQILLSNKATNKKYVTRLGFNVLHAAVINKRFKSLELLLDDPDMHVNSKSIMGITPLMLAAQEDYIEGIELLFKNGAHPDIQDHKGQTALHHAAQHNKKLSIEVLLKNGADPMIKGTDDAYPIDHVINKDIEKIMEPYIQFKKKSLAQKEIFSFLYGVRDPNSPVSRLPKDLQREIITKIAPEGFTLKEMFEKITT